MATDPKVTADPRAVDPRHWRGHVVVCGLHETALRVVEQLRLAGARVVVLEDGAAEQLLHVLREWGVPTVPRPAHLSEPLHAAGVAGAAAVVCLEQSDLRALETVLLVRDLRPDVRVIAHLDNPAVASAVQSVTGPTRVVDVAALFAPSVVQACLERDSHELRVGSERLVTVETTAPRAATLRELYGSLMPLGVAAEHHALAICPGRDRPVAAGDRVTLLGTPAELHAAGLREPAPPGSDVHRLWRRLADRARVLPAQLATNVSRALRIVLLLALTLLLTSTLVLHGSYHRPGAHPHLSVLDAVYFTVETVATVGFGDFSFAGQSTGLEVFGIALIVAGTTLVTTLFALLTNALIGRRLAQSLGQARIPGMRGHIVLVGLGAVGNRVLDGLLARGCQVVVVERDESNRYLGEVRRRGVPLVIGDATLVATLDAVNLTRSRAVAIVTSDDLTNIETGLAVRERFGDRFKAAPVPVVLRVFDRHLGTRLHDTFGFRHVWSTAAIAAPWFVGAALGLDVMSSFYVDSHPFLFARLRVSAGGGLHGLTMAQLGVDARVVAIERLDGSFEHQPRRDTRLEPGDAAYLAGPDDELLALLRRERRGREAAPTAPPEDR